MPWINRQIEHKTGGATNEVVEAFPWTVQYEANELPESATPAWTPNHVPDPLLTSTVEISPAGKLHVSSQSQETSEVVNFTSDTIDFVNSTGFTVEFSAQIVSGTLLATGETNTYVNIAGNTAFVYVNLYTDGIELSDNVGGTNSYSMDTTDGYHTYRLTMLETTTKLYVDGVLRCELTAGLGEDTGYIDFYPASGSYNNSGTEQNWDYIYWRIDGAFAP